MRFRISHPNRLGTWCLVLSVTLVACMALRAEAGRFFRNAAVGGVSIDAQGVLSQAEQQATAGLRESLNERLADVPDEMDDKVTLRKISLRQLETALSQTVNNDIGALPDEIKYLAGLLRIQYVFVYPEQNDIVLAGPSEGWTINDQGTVVGKSTGLPVITLEDLLVSLQTSRSAREMAISCSIDPTPEGTQAMRRFVRQQSRFSPGVVDKMAELMGPQQITITGVSETSHFARVMVAADYRMKRIAMQLEDSPIDGLPSFLQMLAKSRMRLTNMMPRWWLACDYDPLARSDDGLAWEIRGRGVKVMTEDDLVTDDGEVTVTGKQNPVAARWADLMTRKYEELASAEPVFGQLRNLMDLSVVAALIDRERMAETAGCHLPILTGENGDFTLEAWNPPRTVATQCSFLKRGRDYLITASGGVQIDSWYYASKSQPSKAVGEAKQQNEHVADSWWWN